MNLFTFNEIKISYSCKELGPSITNSKSAYDLVLPSWPDIEYVESFLVVLLNRDNKTLGISMISVGGLSGTVADPKKIFQSALKANASGIILCHNHPSGNPKPSAKDAEITQKCKNAGLFLDLPVLDHIIVCRNSYFSFADEGLI